MYDLREQYLNYKPKSYQLQIVETKKNDTRVISNRFFNSYSLHMERANDLQTLCKLRKYDMTGLEIWLYIAMRTGKVYMLEIFMSLKI
jgi:hypothetical protein